MVHELWIGAVFRLVYLEHDRTGHEAVNVLSMMARAQTMQHTRIAVRVVLIRRLRTGRLKSKGKRSKTFKCDVSNPPGNVSKQQVDTETSSDLFSMLIFNSCRTLSHETSTYRPNFTRWALHFMVQSPKAVIMDWFWSITYQIATYRSADMVTRKKLLANWFTVVME